MNRSDDLISRQAAIDAICTQGTSAERDGQYVISLATAKQRAVDVLESLPIIDPVKHGRWIMDENPHDGDCRCSWCGIAINQMHERNHGLLNALTGGKWWAFYKYCPNCGTKMEGEKDGR